MANEIWHNFTTGLTLYARIRRRTDSQVYDVDAGGDNFEAWADGSVATYDLPLVDEDGSFYAVDFPSGISAGVYDVGIFQQATGAPLVTDSAVAEGVMYWDGTAEITQFTIDADIATAQADLDTITGANGVFLDDNAITASKYDESTAFPIVLADTGSDTIARTGADGDTLETLSDAQDDIKGTGFVKADDALTELLHTGADGDTGETLSDQMDASLAELQTVVNQYPTRDPNA